MKIPTLGRYKEWINAVMRSEDLDELPEALLAPQRNSFVSKLLKTESLPLDDRPESRNASISFLTTLFSREKLPVDPVSGPDPVGRAPRR